MFCVVQVWPGATYYPDFLSAPNITQWWTRQLQRMHQAVPYDGQWIDMNEASNFCEGQICKERNMQGGQIGVQVRGGVLLK
jgi:alpha-glucosidase (family GH31 glycosyl hydrolase)